MPELNDLWDWLAYVRQSNAYLIALPSFVAFFLACFTGWVERRQSRGDTLASAESQSPAREPTVLATVDGRAARQLDGLHIGGERASAFVASQPDEREAKRSRY